MTVIEAQRPAELEGLLIFALSGTPTVPRRAPRNRPCPGTPQPTMEVALHVKEEKEKEEGLLLRNKRYGCIMSPTNRFRLVWDFVLLCLIVYIAVRTGPPPSHVNQTPEDELRPAASAAAAAASTASHTQRSQHRDGKNTLTIIACRQPHRRLYHQCVTPYRLGFSADAEKFSTVYWFENTVVSTMRWSGTRRPPAPTTPATISI